MKQRLFFLLILAVAGMIACNKNSDSSIPETSSNINFFTAVPGREYDVLIDTTTIGSAVGYGESTGYHSFLAKRYTLRIYPAGNHTVAIGGGEISLRNGHYYSVFLSLDNTRTLQLRLVEDHLAPSRANFGKVRYINLSDTYTTPTSRLTLDMYVDNVRIFRRQGYLAATDFAEVSVGTRNVDLRYADSSLSLMGNNSHSYEIQDQKQYTIIGYGNVRNVDSFKLVTFVH
ncbi:DUF4397 domain-containing protein [Chitinophaga ginsengisoli]|uniref:Uncharacterized protein DUF4397 n=1 Tax=Chitinophaga ginsengisoli TaxID=363837 RepID=A0A2P8G757_9BACT|nr:DUF4397 domain-containing protein [Chitinophaga ginsengisoli]PSL29715.1 uncharacterized protein DUF4397 [Chitinophaga ginsengisoli]